MKTTYLELSEDNGAAHKFYEVCVEAMNLIVKFGRIGTSGTVSRKTFPTPEAAQKEAEKKIRQKKSKGYAPAKKGVRKKRPITRRHIESYASTSKKSPLLWKFNSGAPAFGIFVDENHCWVGNQNGSIYCLDHNADVVNQYRLPNGVKSLVSDGLWLYAGCDDGNVYDLTGKIPRQAYEVQEGVDIFWMDTYTRGPAIDERKLIVEPKA